MSIVIENLNHIYNKGTVYEKHAIKNINLEIKKGEFIGVIGHTGSGKSTLMQHLNALIYPDSGSISYKGKNIFESKESAYKIKQKVGLVFQYPEHQLFEVTVIDDVSFGPRNMNLSEEEVSSRAKKALKLVSIPENIFQKSPFELSGGQKRRVALAGILAMEPEVLVLDEPNAGLDPKSRNEILSEINNLQKTLGITVVLVSHSMEDIANFVEKIVVMQNGEIIYFDTPAEIFKKKTELEKMGLRVPQITELIIKLREKGFDLSDEVFTVEGASKEILKLIKQVQK